MKCKDCGSTNILLNGKSRGKQQYRCGECGSQRQPVMDYEAPPHRTQEAISHQPQSIEDFLKENDAPAIVAGKVDAALAGISPNELLFIDSLYERIGLPQGYPHLRTTIDSYREYYGKGMVDGKLRFGHPDTIAMLKQKKAMK